MNASDATSVRVTENIRDLVRATIVIVIVGWAGDFLFWRSVPGASVGVFGASLGIGLFVTGRRTTRAAATLALLLATCVQSAVELCFTNTASLALLLIMLSGEAVFDALAEGWARWSEAFISLIGGPLRWVGFMRTWAETRLAASGTAHLRGPMLGRAIGAGLPVAIVTLIFGALLAAGNAVLAEAFLRIGTRLETWLLDISISRTALWVLWLTVGVALFWPATAPTTPRWWTRAIPRIERRDALTAIWQSGLLLLGVNALFFAANTADAIYLWRDARLPAGVNPSRFLHEGVHALIAAVILAAAVLAVLFQQSERIAQTRTLRVLALAWIAQNVVLIAGVLRRLQLYVEAYQLSELRVYVGCFLLLVATGFVLLALHVWRGMNLGRLILHNSAAALLLIFVLQFCDVGTWVAQCNVARWKADRRRVIDLDYLVDLGPRGWLALDEVARDSRKTAASEDARAILEKLAVEAQVTIPLRDWRSLQLRRDSRAAWLTDTHLPSP